MRKKYIEDALKIYASNEQLYDERNITQGKSEHSFCNMLGRDSSPESFVKDKKMKEKKNAEDNGRLRG